VAKLIKKKVQINKTVEIGDVPRLPVLSPKDEEIRTDIPLRQFINTEVAVISHDIAGYFIGRERELSSELEKAYRDGYDKGLKDGIAKERSEKIKSIETLLAEAKKKKRDAIRNLEYKIVDLASTIAMTIVRESITKKPELIANIVTDVISQIIGSEKMILKVSAEDFTVVKSRYNEWMAMTGNTAEFKIEIDQRLRRGDCLVESEGGIIDAVVSDRIDVIVEEMLNI